MFKVPVLLAGLFAYNTNPFEDAISEAQSVGSYLGYMIGKEMIFGDC
jgi:hypothetical protein